MRNMYNAAVKDEIFSIVTTRNLCFGYFTCHITCLEEQYLLLIDTLAMMRKLSFQFERGVQRY